MGRAPHRPRPLRAVTGRSEPRQTSHSEVLRFVKGPSEREQASKYPGWNGPTQRELDAILAVFVQPAKIPSGVRKEFERRHGRILRQLINRQYVLSEQTLDINNPTVTTVKASI